MTRMAVVFNPLKVREDQLRRAFEQGMEAAAWDAIDWYPTTPDDFGRGIAARAVRSGADVVAAAGGDGTVRDVAFALRGTGTPMAIVPQGTGNLLARNLGLPLGLDASVGIAFGPGERQIDVGMLGLTRQDGSSLDPDVFLVMAGMGIDAEMIRATRPVLKKTIGWMAYADAVWRTLPKSKSFRVGYRVDDHEPRSSKVHSMVIANCDTLPGGLRIVPDSEPDDGFLDIAGFRPRGPFGVAKVWTTVAIENSVLRRFAWGRRISDQRTSQGRDVIYRRGTRVSLWTPEPVGVQVDGDDLGDAVAVSVEIEVGALRVKIPISRMVDEDSSPAELEASPARAE